MLEIINSARELPEDWDQIAEEYFQRKEFLIHTEEFNPCGQRYFLLKNEGKTVAGAVVYTLRLDILTYLKIKSPLKMRICGIPCSVSASGLFGQNGTDLLPMILKQERGFKLFLNLDEPPESGLAAGTTFPTIIMNNPFSSMRDYETAMRYEYRRRYNKTHSAFRDVNAVRSDCSCFGESEYKLYLNVLKKSEGKLETLSQDFFANLPSTFRLSRFYTAGKLIGWNITVLYQNTMYFFLGGIDYEFNNKYSTYFNILYDIIEQGISCKATRIELGQTAEVPKLRTGGAVVNKYMLAQHSSKIISKALKLAEGLLQYKCDFPHNHVFKGDTEG